MQNIRAYNQVWILTKDVDGCHRYIASKIAGVSIAVQPATQSISKVSISWDDIPIGKGWK